MVIGISRAAVAGVRGASGVAVDFCSVEQADSIIKATIRDDEILFFMSSSLLNFVEPVWFWMTEPYLGPGAFCPSDTSSAVCSSFESD
jgi:hypothetical protein